MYKSRDYNSTIFFLLRRELHQMCRYECNLVKNFSTYWEIRKENRKTNESILAS